PAGTLNMVFQRTRWGSKHNIKTDLRRGNLDVAYHIQCHQILFKVWLLHMAQSMQYLFSGNHFPTAFIAYKTKQTSTQTCHRFVFNHIYAVFLALITSVFYGSLV